MENKNKKQNNKKNNNDRKIINDIHNKLFYLEKPITLAEQITKIVITDKTHGDIINQLAEYPIELEQVIYKTTVKK